MLRRGLLEHTGKVFGLHDSDSGAYLASHWQAISSGMFLLCGLPQESGRCTIYRGRHQPEPLHRRFPQVGISCCIAYFCIYHQLICSRKFAPRCCVCRQPILPEPGKEETVRVVALDRSFHVSCYKCEVSICLLIIYTLFNIAIDRLPWHRTVDFCCPPRLKDADASHWTITFCAKAATRNVCKHSPAICRPNFKQNAISTADDFRHAHCHRVDTTQIAF